MGWTGTSVALKADEDRLLLDHNDEYSGALKGSNYPDTITVKLELALMHYASFKVLVITLRQVLKHTVTLENRHDWKARCHLELLHTFECPISPL